METSPLTEALRGVLGGLSEAASGSDGQLLERFVAGHDEAAFAALMRRHGPMVFRLCQRMLANRADAEDVFQATFVVLARRAAVVKGPSLASWLHGVARRIARDVRRSASRRRDREQSLGEAKEGIADREAPAGPSEGDLRPILDEELGRLPERYRAPIVLCYLEGRSTDEAAAELGLARGTVASRMSRGRDLLRNRLARRGLALSAAAFPAWLAESAASAAIPAATLHALIPAGLISGSAVSERVALLAKSVTGAMFWAKLRWGGALLVCLLVFGTAGVKWAGSTSKPTANANASGGQGDDFYVRWSFDKGPPQDIRVLGARWEHRPGNPGTMAAVDASLLLPTRIPKQPFVVSLKLHKGPRATTASVSKNKAWWVNGRKTCPRRVWGVATSGESGRWINIYFMGHWSVTMDKDQVQQIIQYQEPYPGQQIYIGLHDIGIEEIQLHSLRPDKGPPAMRNMHAMIKAMRVKPEDHPGLTILP